MILTKNELNSFLKAENKHPHNILGMHPCSSGGKKGLVVRAFISNALSCDIVDVDSESNTRYPLVKISPEGFFEGFIADRTKVFAYRLRVEQFNSEFRQFHDPYCFFPTLSDNDLYLFNEGNEHFIYNKLGAHIRNINNIPGVSFSVWAPTAKRISVVGDFNNWDGRYHPMRSIGSSGVWEIFIPGLKSGSKYKYEILTDADNIQLKTDPYATYFESPPHNASIVYPLEGYEWNDQNWIEARKNKDWSKEPVNIYELHIGSWKKSHEHGYRSMTYREIASELVDYVNYMGFTHVEFMPLAEHPFDGSWGYQVTGFFAPTYRFGTPKDFMYLVDTLHKNNTGVIMDWVPAHFPTDAFSLAHFGGDHLYEHADPKQGYHQDWGTLIFNYGRHEVRGFLIASALAWFDRYHIDGLRVDAVASMLYLDYSRDEGEWIPNQYGDRENLEAIDFLKKTNQLIHQYYPGSLMIAEESTAWEGVTSPVSKGGLGFDLKWNLGWMHDTLEYFGHDPIHRKWHQNKLTFGMIYQYSEKFVQVFSHDEVVHGKASMINKMSAHSMTEKAQTLRALYTFMWVWPGKNTLFMGCEFGQSSEWSYDSELDWHLLKYKDHEGIQAIIRDLNNLINSEKSLYQYDYDHDYFEWVSIDDSSNSVFSFLRKGKKPDETFLAVGHFTPVPRYEYRIGVPHSGFWKEVINSNAHNYGGNGSGNFGGCYSEDVPSKNQKYSLSLTLPAMSTTIFKFAGK